MERCFRDIVGNHDDQVAVFIRCQQRDISQLVNLPGNFVEVLIRTPELHLTQLPYNLVERRSYYDTAEQKNRDAERALTNINSQIKTLELVLNAPTKTELDNLSDPK